MAGHNARRETGWSQVLLCKTPSGYEVELVAGRSVLLPITFARIRKDRVEVHALMSDQFGNVPALKNPDQVTLLEEEKICAYYGAGTLYATPQRQEPLV